MVGLDMSNNTTGAPFCQHIRAILDKMLMLLAVVICIELVFYMVRPLWHIRGFLALLTAVIISFSTGAILSQGIGALQLAILVLSIGRIFNMLRILEGRMHEGYLRRAALRTSVVFAFVQLIFIAAMQLGVTVGYAWLLMPLVWLQLIVAAGIGAVAITNIRKTRHLAHIENYSDKELPTVSLLIPARNETRDLEDCLRTALASDYPKLEVIVLDDCSQDKTSEIIRDFAQDGVRFIKGSPPHDRWLAKNQAYERLQEEASGELLLFAGVDVRFGVHSIRALVTTMLNRKKGMVSVMPRRLNSTILASVVQPMRYWWELALPRRILNRPPVLSTCWLIAAKSLHEHGSFAAVSHAIIPEVYFARELVKKSDGYSFVRSDDVLDIQTVKSLTQQRETAVRVRYPQIRRRPENALFLAAAELLFLLGPFILIGLYAVGAVGFPVWIAIVACLLLVATHVTIVTISNPANVPIALFNFPIVVLTELILGMTSMLRYEFSVVDWKGRNICIPVMHVLPKLPPLSERR
jgi:glycosyltransferase involved in cell wall biosynthesis